MRETFFRVCEDGSLCGFVLFGSRQTRQCLHFRIASSAQLPVSISLWLFLPKHLQIQGHLFCWYLLFSREQTRYLQQDGGSEVILVPVSTTEEFSPLICRCRKVSCVLLRSLAKWLGLCLFSLFWMEQPACCGADGQVVSGSSSSG